MSDNLENQVFAQFFFGHESQTKIRSLLRADFTFKVAVLYFQ